MIINPFSSIPSHPKSHVRGWAQHWANSLNVKVAHKGDDFSQESDLYIDHGVNFGGGLNLLGGVTQEVFDNLQILVNSKARLFSLDIDMPDYGTMLRKRIGQATCHKDLHLIIDALEEKFKSAQTLTQYDLIHPKNICIGDSHATAYADKNSAVIKKNGQTLYGALQNDYINDVLSKTTKKYDKITLCLGSIDVRHHLARLDNPQDSLKQLLDRYISLSKEVASKHQCLVEISCPPPVEFENRRIPQTGLYKGTPFYGSLEERKKLTYFFIAYLIEQGANVVHQPIERYEMNPEEYAKEYMELSSSVHIAPIHYRSNSDWGM